MSEADYTSLQERYGGLYVARQGSEVVASADTYDALSDALERATVEWADLIVEYVERTDCVGAY